MVPDFWIESITNAGYYKLMGIFRGGYFSIVSKYFEDANSSKAFSHEGDVSVWYTDRKMQEKHVTP